VSSSKCVDVCIVTRSISEILPETLGSLLLNREFINSIILITAKLDIDDIHRKILKILKKYSKLTIIVKDGPLGYLRNICLDISSRDYICMVDSDIVLTRDYFKKILKSFNNTKIAAVGPKIISIVDKWGALLEESLVYAHSKVFSDPPCGGTVYRRDIISRIRFNNTLRGGEDHDLNKRLKCENYRIVIRDDVEIYHRYRGTIRENLIKHLDPSSSGAQHFSIKSLLVRTFASIPRGVIYMIISSRLGRTITILLPIYYFLRWLFTLIGNILHRR